MELAYYYNNNLQTNEDLEKLLVDVSRCVTHEWVLYYAVYYSSWTRSMVPEKDKVFAEYDMLIIQCTIDEADQSLQHVLMSIIKVIGYDNWKKHLKDKNTNCNIGILKEKYVVGPEFITNMDIIETRH
jgi:hypothetical protein